MRKFYNFYKNFKVTRRLLLPLVVCVHIHPKEAPDAGISTLHFFLYRACHDYYDKPISPDLVIWKAQSYHEQLGLDLCDKIQRTIDNTLSPAQVR